MCSRISKEEASLRGNGPPAGEKKLSWDYVRVRSITFKSERPNEVVVHGESLFKVTKCNLKKRCMPS